MNETVLIVDDQQEVLDLLKISLKREGYIVRTAASGQEAIDCISEQMPDLILLDILMQDISGIKITSQLKSSSKTAHIPVILLTAKDTETDIVVGLGAGADDYVTKPFSMHVLKARMEAVLRRLKASMEDQQVVHAGPLRLFPNARRIVMEDLPLNLTSAEYDILCELIKARGAIRTREELMKAAGAGDTDNLRLVDVHIASIRKKMGKGRKIIRTVQGRGYTAVF